MVAGDLGDAGGGVSCPNESGVITWTIRMVNETRMILDVIASTFPAEYYWASFLIALASLA